jgi:hypothetical protein
MTNLGVTSPRGCWAKASAGNPHSFFGSFPYKYFRAEITALKGFVQPLGVVFLKLNFCTRILIYINKGLYPLKDFLIAVSDRTSIGRPYARTCLVGSSPIKVRCCLSLRR